MSNSKSLRSHAANEVKNTETLEPGESGEVLAALRANLVVAFDGESSLEPGDRESGELPILLRFSMV